MKRIDTYHWLRLLVIPALLLCVAPLLAAADTPKPRTTADPEISLPELELLLKPLPKVQLLVEADSWQALLQEKAEAIAQVEVAIERENQAIAAAQEAVELAKEAKEQLDEAKEQASVAATLGDQGAAEKAVEAAGEAREITKELKERVATTSAGSAASVIQDEGASIADKTGILKDTAAQAEVASETKKKEKVNLLKQVTVLREDRTGLIDRLRSVLDELESKTDAADTDTLAKVQDLRLYSSAVGGVKIDVGDGTAAWIAVKGWLLSEEGGQRWALNFAKFLSILIAAWIVSIILSSTVRHALARVQGTSRLLENFLIKLTRWVVVVIGLIMALASLEISIGPLLAVVGAAGFVIAFALQDSLSNFASGLMILFFRPFDEGDVVDAGGVSGKVQSMNLVSTTIQTFDNKRMVVPNNKIWNDVITNATAVRERRVDMEFGIGYDDDIDKAHGILEDIISSHEKVLKEPEPTIKVNALADSSINFIARPWALTADYWDVYWDVTRAVKQRFDEAKIGIPFPQRDVHLYIQGGDSNAAVPAALSGQKAPPGKESKTIREDGGLDEDNGG